MHRILILAAFGAAVSLSSGAFAQAKKKPHPLCAMDACMAFCAKQGGQPRLCPDFCVKRTAERKAAGQCG